MAIQDRLLVLVHNRPYECFDRTGSLTFHHRRNSLFIATHLVQVRSCSCVQAWIAFRQQTKVMTGCLSRTFWMAPQSYDGLVEGTLDRSPLEEIAVENSKKDLTCRIFQIARAANNMRNSGFNEFIPHRWQWTTIQEHQPCGWTRQL